MKKNNSNSNSEIHSMYFKEVESEIRFIGELTDRDSVQVTIDLAVGCASYMDDDEDEKVIDEAITCFNCRYRIWRNVGFTCYNKF
jgi:uncharacterized radical SAM superfamily Fe-S cluster-containing enzyme